MIRTIFFDFGNVVAFFDHRRTVEKLLRHTDLSAEQKTQIKQRLSGGPKAENVNVSISVGTRLPRTVEIRPLPAAIIEIVPQYRGYYYVIVRDEIVIVSNP